MIDYVTGAEMSNASEPAFPIQGNWRRDMAGLTKREYYAACAMQGLCSTYTIGRDQPELQSATAESAVKYADALIAALEDGK